MNKDPLLGFVDTDQAGKFALNLPEATRVGLRALHPRYVGPIIDGPEDGRTLRPVTLSRPGGSSAR